MRKFLGAILACAAVTTGGSAYAQDWERYSNDGGRYDRRDDDHHYGRRDDDRGALGHICSGQRGYQVENRLRNEDLDRRLEWRIQNSIDGLQNRQRVVCAQRDWREIRLLDGRYDVIERWIDNSARAERGRRW
ncbi:MAG: hypothetical protein ABIT04_13785 [Novosphingobium sp.]